MVICIRTFLCGVTGTFAGVPIEDCSDKEPGEGVPVWIACCRERWDLSGAGFPPLHASPLLLRESASPCDRLRLRLKHRWESTGSFKYPLSACDDLPWPLGWGKEGKKTSSGVCRMSGMELSCDVLAESWRRCRRGGAVSFSAYGMGRNTQFN